MFCVVFPTILVLQVLYFSQNKSIRYTKVSIVYLEIFFIFLCVHEVFIDKKFI